MHIKHTITLRQYKYWFLLLKSYKDFWEKNIEMDENGFYFISISEITKLMGYEPVKKELKSDLEKLRKEPIIINFLEKNKKSSTHGMGFISEWKITSNKIAFKLPSFIENVLKGSIEAKQMFLLLNWEIFNSFSGKYEAIIYKLCKDYVGVGRTPSMSVEKYREYIGLKDNEYTSTDDFTKRCIRNPVNKINKNEASDILISVLYTTSGRKITGVSFDVKYKQNTIIPVIENNDKNPAFEKSIIPLALEKQRRYLGTYSEEEIQAIIEYVNEQYEQGKIKNLSVYYYQAFENGWGLENFKIKQKEKAEAEAKRLEIKAKKEAERKAKAEAEAKERAEKERIDKAIKIFESLPADEQEKILDELESLVPPFMKKYFSERRKAGEKPYKTPPYNFALREVIEANHPQELNQ